jgi:hypothetical protein
MKVGYAPIKIELQDSFKLISLIPKPTIGKAHLVLISLIALTGFSSYGVQSVLYAVTGFSVFYTIYKISTIPMKLGYSAYKAVRDYEPPAKPRRFELDFKPLTLNVKEPEHRPDSAQTFHQLGDTKESDDDDGEGGEPCKDERDETHQQRQKLSWEKILDQLNDLEARVSKLEEASR